MSVVILLLQFILIYSLYLEFKMHLTLPESKRNTVLTAQYSETPLERWGSYLGYEI